MVFARNPVVFLHRPRSVALRAAMALALAALVAAGCAPRPTPTSGLSAIAPAAGSGVAGSSGAATINGDISAYRLGPGDKVKVTVFGQPAESGLFEVDGSGNLGHPLLGAVPAQGLTVPELQERLRADLDRGFIVNPRVTVEVANYRPFYIYGEVQKAGSYPYVAGLTVRRAVAIAGGYTRRARFAPVQIVRETASGPREVNAELDVPVLPGDTVQIMQRLF